MDSSNEHGLILYEHHDQPPFGDQGLAFQTQALQIILFGPSTCEPNTVLGPSRIESLQIVNGQHGLKD